MFFWLQKRQLRDESRSFLDLVNVPGEVDAIEIQGYTLMLPLPQLSVPLFLDGL